MGNQPFWQMARKDPRFVSLRTLIEQILEQKRFAVTGVSRNPEKYGNIVYQRLKAAGYTVYAINPNTDSIGGDPCYPSLDNVPAPIDCVVTVTLPHVTEKTMRDAGHLKIPFVWMQPGSESTSAYNLARSLSMQVISGGPCIMVSIAQRQTHNGGNG
jgi:predicted CoA-binding protein